MKILAVDDDKTILELLSEALDVSGFSNVTTANSGEAALHMIAEASPKFDCFLLDIQMPGMDGIALCAEIRATPGYSQTPIVMVTAMSQKEYIDRAFSAGATDYVTKPFDVMELGTRLRMAQKLVNERNRVRDGMVEVLDLKKELDSNLSHSLNEPVELLGVERVTGLVGFENTIMQMSMGALFFANVFAVKVTNINEIYKAASATQFREFLTRAATFLSEKTELDGNVLTYRGNGVFLVLQDGGIQQRIEEFEKSLDKASQRFFANEAARLGLPVAELLVGEACSLGGINKASSLNALRKAAESVEKRQQYLRSIAEVPDHPEKIVEEISEAERQSKRRVYEAMLNDCLSDIAPPALRT